MPHFLVTHTSLVEAVDEATAAEIVQAKIAGGDLVSFDVRADEHRITKIAVQAKVTVEPPSLNSVKPSSQSLELGLLIGAARPADVGIKASMPRQETVRRSRSLAYCTIVGTAAAFFLLGHYLR